MILSLVHGGSVEQKNMVSKLFFLNLTPLECSEYMFYVRQQYHINELPTLPDNIFNGVLNRLIPDLVYHKYILETNRSKVDWELMSENLKYKTYTMLMQKYEPTLSKFIDELDYKLREYNISEPYEEV